MLPASQSIRGGYRYKGLELISQPNQYTIPLGHGRPMVRGSRSAAERRASPIVPCEGFLGRRYGRFEVAVKFSPDHGSDAE